MKNHMPLKKKKKASWSSTQESDHMMMISFTTTTLSLNLREILTVLPNPKITTHETSGGAPEAFLAAPPVITKRF
jgi:hypothetical protein